MASVSSVEPRRGASSTSTTVSPLRDVIGHRDDLLGHAALVGRGERALVRAQRPAVEVGAGDLELVADLGRLDEHLLAAEGVGQAVVDHRVERLGVAHAVAEARVGQQVGRLGHRLHAAADADLDVARADRLVEQDRGADAASRRPC